mmetsp:Transcript_47499/g.75540  ORF Transcript_47499/g.75540 Transcript_47499/m.75540 type:complete len:249 (-) Transcript_47499:112-858(-)
MTTTCLSAGMAVLRFAGTLLDALVPEMRRGDVETLHLRAISTAGAATVLLRVEHAAETTAAVLSIATAVGVPALTADPRGRPRLRTWHYILRWYRRCGQCFGDHGQVFGGLAMSRLHVPAKVRIAAACATAAMREFRAANPFSAFFPEVRGRDVELSYQWICGITGGAVVLFQVVAAAEHAAAVLPVSAGIGVPGRASVRGFIRGPGLGTWNRHCTWHFWDFSASVQVEKTGALKKVRSFRGYRGQQA